MKKILMGLLLIVSIFTLTACTSDKISKINYEKLMKKFDNQETFILLFNDESTDGKLLKNTLNDVLNEFNLEAYMINPTKLSQEEKNNLRSIIYVEVNGIAFINKGIDSSKLGHITSTSASKEDIKNNLINHGFVDTNTENTEN